MQPGKTRALLHNGFNGGKPMKESEIIKLTRKHYNLLLKEFDNPKKMDREKAEKMVDYHAVKVLEYNRGIFVFGELQDSRSQLIEALIKNWDAGNE